MITLKAGTLRSCASKSSKGALFLFQGDMAVVYPEGVGLGGGFGQLMDRAEKAEDRVGVLHVELILIEIP